jgi:hypothetical protein
VEARALIRQHPNPLPTEMTSPMTPEAIVQRQFEAANGHDIHRFIAEFAEDARIYSPPAPEPTLAGKAAIAAHYSTKRFNLPALHYELVSRIVTGNMVVDHERISGVQPEPYEAILVYQVAGTTIQTVWLFRPA